MDNGRRTYADIMKSTRVITFFVFIEVVGIRCTYRGSTRIISRAQQRILLFCYTHCTVVVRTKPTAVNDVCAYV